MIYNNIKMKFSNNGGDLWIIKNRIMSVFFVGGKDNSGNALFVRSHFKWEKTARWFFGKYHSFEGNWVLKIWQTMGYLYKEK